MASLMANTASVSGHRRSTSSVAARPLVAVKSPGTRRTGRPASVIAETYASTGRRVQGIQLGPATIAMRRRPEAYRCSTIAVVAPPLSMSSDGTPGPPVPIETTLPASLPGRACRICSVVLTRTIPHTLRSAAIWSRTGKAESSGSQCSDAPIPCGAPASAVARTTRSTYGSSSTEARWPATATTSRYPLPVTSARAAGSGA
jgi:hypothetical protein